MSRLFGDAKVAPLGASTSRQLVQVLASPARQVAASEYITQALADARYARVSHSHAIADVSGLQAALNGKQAASQNLYDWDSLIQTVGGGRGGYVQRVYGEWVVTADVPAIDLSGTLRAAQFPALTGDVTTTAGSLATTLASVVAAGTMGSANTVPIPTWDAKGRITGMLSATITPAAIGALPVAGTAADSSKLGGQNPSYYQPRTTNLDFLSAASGNGLVYMGGGGLSASTLSNAYLVRGDGSGILASTYLPVAAGASNPLTGTLYANLGVNLGSGALSLPTWSITENAFSEMVIRKSGTVKVFVGSKITSALDIWPNGSGQYLGASGLEWNAFLGTAYVSSLAATGLVKAGAGGILQVAGISDLPGGPYLPLSAGSGKQITGTLYLNNGVQGSGLATFDDFLLNQEATFYGDIIQPGRSGHRRASLLDLDVATLAFASSGNGGIKGRTDASNAASGDVGERIASAITNTSPVSISTSGTAIDVTSITLPSGDWDTDASIIFSANVSGTTRARAAISEASATVASDGYEADGTIATASGAKLCMTMHKQIQFSGADRVVYLSAVLTGTFGAANCWGHISARRRR